MGTVGETLHAFGASTLVVRAVGAVLDVGGGAALPPWPTIEAAVDSLVPRADAALRGRVAEGVADPGSLAILALGAAVDGADRVLARSGNTAVEPQADDAVLKALAIAAMARRLGGDTPGARVERLLTLRTGVALIATWAAADVVLPVGGVDLRRLLTDRQPAQASRLAALAGEDALDGVVPALGALLPALQAAIDRAVPQANALAVALAPYVPGLVADAAGSHELIALQCDRLPIYKWLAARLAVEHAVRRLTGG